MSFIAQKGRAPGQYWPTFTESGARSAVFYCPTCGKGMSLNAHEINARGVVQPSVVEPANPHPKCPVPNCGTFHDHIILADWITPEDLQKSAEQLKPYYDNLANPSKEENTGVGLIDGKPVRFKQPNLTNDDFGPEAH